MWRVWALILLGLLPTPWTARAGLDVVKAGGGSSAASSAIHFGVLVVLQAFLFRLAALELRAVRQFYRSATVYPHVEPLLGLDLLARTLRAIRDDMVLPFMEADFNRLGSTYFFVGLGRWVINTREPENLRAMLSNPEDWVIAGPRLESVLPILGPHSVFSSNGPQWRHSRAMLRPSFVRDQVADLRCFDRHISNLLRRIPRDGAAVDLQDLLLRVTMDASTEFLLGSSTESLTSPTPEGNDFLAAYDYATFHCGARGRLGFLTRVLPNRRLRRSIATVHAYVERYVTDALGRAGAADDGNSKTGSAPSERGYVFLREIAHAGASRDYLRDQVLSVIVAGRDTTAAAITCVCWTLARRPDVVEKLRAEILGLGVRDPTWEQLKGMKYLKNTVRESLRLFPPVASNSRTASRDTVLPLGGGRDGRQPLRVPEGTPCRWSLYSMHRRRDIFGDDADEFRPERWETLRPSWEYLPFSGGPRVCLGQQFALTQTSLLLFRLFQNFSAIRPRDPDAPMRIRISLTASLADGCWVKLTPA